MTSDLWGVYLRHDGNADPLYTIVRADNAADAHTAAARQLATPAKPAATFRAILATRLPIMPQPVHVLCSRGVAAA